MGGGGQRSIPCEGGKRESLRILFSEDSSLLLSFLWMRFVCVVQKKEDLGVDVYGGIK